ncbi:MAG TPA: AbrB/MazE/SpoVT family DNA-binding domain-containing protein [Caldilineae bacterium]|nr:AbrB/MazE/SpoVT family DNA-binding domain-containing protein [Caldilineae bacterium]
MPIVTLSNKGQIVLPREIRQALGLRKGDKPRITIEEGYRLVLTPLPFNHGEDWRRWRGYLAGTKALQKHIAQHAQEIEHV